MEKSGGVYIDKCNLEKRVVFLTADQITKKLKEPNPIFFGEPGNGKMFDARKGTHMIKSE